MRPGVHEQLGGVGGVLGQAAAPRAAVNEDVDRRVRAAGWVDVQCFDGRRAVRVASGNAQASAHAVAVGRVALDDLGKIRSVLALIVGGIELGLIHVEPHDRALDARCRLSGRWLLREYRAGRQRRTCDRGPQKRPASNGSAIQTADHIHSDRSLLLRASSLVTVSAAAYPYRGTSQTYW